MTTQLTNNIMLEQTDEHIHLSFQQSQQVISSAVLNGGICHANHVVNMKVDGKTHNKITESPADTLAKYCIKQNWQGNSVAMMTAAPMKSFRITQREEQGIKIVVMLTSGLNNARRAGDTAEYQTMQTTVQKVGTINIIALTTAQLTTAACIEAIQMITEAKTTVLQNLNILSPVSDQIATGTGTDATVFINGNGPGSVEYCGKHVLFGEILAKLVIESLYSSLDFYHHD